MEESKTYKLDRPAYTDNVNVSTDSLATELLHEVKKSGQRWFIAFLIVLGLWFATIGVFIWYISLPVEEYSISQDAQDIETSNINQTIGGDSYGTGKTDSKLQEESSEE